MVKRVKSVGERQKLRINNQVTPLTSSCIEGAINEVESYIIPGIAYYCSRELEDRVKDGMTGRLLGKNRCRCLPDYSA